MGANAFSLCGKVDDNRQFRGTLVEQIDGYYQAGAHSGLFAPPDRIEIGQPDITASR
jgi:hypothetical protein